MSRNFFTHKAFLGLLLSFCACLINPGCAHNRSEVRLEPIMPPPEPALVVEETAQPSPLREGYIIPVEHPSLRISSDFGARRGGGRYHKGIDFDVPEGIDVMASHEGITRFSGWDGAYGKIVILGHESDYETAYAHLCECYVEENETVRQGQIIGRVGCTGNATGSHLHFELRKNGEPVDPNAFLSVAAK